MNDLVLQQADNGYILTPLDQLLQGDVDTKTIKVFHTVSELCSYLRDLEDADDHEREAAQEQEDAE